MKRACKSVEWQMGSVMSQASRRMGIGAIEFRRESSMHSSKQDGCSEEIACLIVGIDLTFEKGAQKIW